MKKAHTILRKYWGYDTFRPLQAEIIQAVLQKRNVLALMPTGGGKSLCFQLPALINSGVTMVISPLVALMQDQVYQLKRRNISAAALYSGMKQAELINVLERGMYGDIKLLYLSPERLKSPLFLERLPHLPLSLIAVDEAHCISQWGYDFRPAYLEIPLFKKKHPQVPLIALTATATPQVQVDIQSKLAMTDPLLLKKSFARDNLAYIVRQTPNKRRTLLGILQKIVGSALIYANTRAKTEELAVWLQKQGISTDYYHAGLDPAIRKAKQEAWIKEAKRVMVATNAFGMGIDKPNVRLVVHINPPSTLEAYYQEAGRVGRDEKKAYAVLLCDEVDAEELLSQVAGAHLPLSEVKNLYQLLANYHQVAVGSHAGVTYPLDIAHLAATYNLTIKKIQLGLRQLQAAGLVQFDDQFALPAKVHIVLESKQLYAFQVANKVMSPLLQALINTYRRAIFYRFTPISLQLLAKILAIPQTQVQQQLQALERLNVINYSPAGKLPQLTFLTPRYDVARLPLSGKEARKRQKVRMDKAKSVNHYMMHTYRCRSQLLLTYFGEDTDALCKMCDICVSKKPNNKEHKAYNTYRAWVKKRLQEKPMGTHTLMDQVDIEAREMVTIAIETMLEQGEIAYDKQLQLVYKNLA